MVNKYSIDKTRQDKTRQDKTRQDNRSSHSKECQVVVLGQMDNTLDHTFESANRVYDKNQLCPTIPTCAGGNIQPKVIEETRCVGGLNDKQWGKQYHQQDRVYKGDIALAQPANLPEGSYKYVMEELKIKQATKEGTISVKVGGCYDASFPGSTTPRGRVQEGGDVAPTLTAGSNENIHYEEEVKHENKREENILQVLSKRIDTETFCKWAIRGLFCILQTEILRQNLHAKRLFEDWGKSSELGKFTSDSTIDKCFIPTEENLRDLWKDWEIRCTSFRRQLPKQQYEQFASDMQELSHEDTQTEKFMQNMWEPSEGIWILRETLSAVQKVWKSTHYETIFRIRKLTPLETWRLMGYTDEDFYKAASVNSNTQLYKQAGNAIVKQVLMAIFKQMLPEQK